MRPGHARSLSTHRPRAARPSALLLALLRRARWCWLSWLEARWQGLKQWRAQRRAAPVDRPLFETLEPKLLLSADLLPAGQTLVPVIEQVVDSSPAATGLAAASTDITIQAYDWKSHKLLAGVDISPALGAPVTTDAQGSALLSVVSGATTTLSVTRAVPAGEADATGQAVNLQDAIGVLKMVVGLDVNGAGKPLSPYQAIAADFDGNGAVELSDAIGVLKNVVGLPVAQGPRWVFVDEADTTVPGKAGLTPGLIPATTTLTVEPTAGVVGVLRGDVDGGWVAPTGAPQLDSSHFNALITKVNEREGVVKLTGDAWGIRPSLLRLNLDAASDTGVLGDFETTQDTVTLVGQTQAGVDVSLKAGGSVVATTQSDAQGAFSFAGVALAIGANAFELILKDATQSTSTNRLQIMRSGGGADVSAPVLSAALANDTGKSASDGITRDASMAGTVSDDTGVTRLLAVLDPGQTPSYTDLSASVQTDGSFSLARGQLDALAGGNLADGAHILRLIAQDAAGNTSAPVDLSFTLDTQVPGGASFGIASADALNGDDGKTAAAIATLRGTAEAGATITLAAQGLSTVASQTGAFQLPGVAFASDDNTVSLTVTDAADNRQTVQRTVTRVVQVQADAVLVWNDIALRAIQLDVTDPPVATRNLALVSLAQYDTLAAIEGTPAYLVQRSVTGAVNAQAAVAAAAHRILSLTYPAQKSVFDTALASSLAGIAEGAAKDAGITLGLGVADAVLAIRADDGANAFADYSGSTAVGRWRPTGPMFELADNPHWASVTPFALSSAGEFRPAAPPAVDSAAYAQDLNEIKALGSANSPTRTADQTEQAHFWADGKGSTTPPGHWNKIASQVALASGNSLSANARLFAQLNVALADAAIACWDAKYFYGAWRPETAIQDAELDNNAATTDDDTWRSLLITPPHPDYVSGHSAFSAAAAAVLAETFGDDTSFTTSSATLADVTRSFSSFSQAADEAGRSRVYGGIHFEYANRAGKALGTQVAQSVLQRFALTQDTRAPSVVIAATPAAVKANLTLTGQALDNLAGLASATVGIDGAVAQALVLDANGGFSLTTTLATDGSADGSHTVTFTATDAAGNTSAAFSRSFVLDTTTPSISLASLAEANALGNSSRLSGTVDGTGSAIVSLRYSIGGGAERTLAVDTGSGSFDEPLALGKLAVGTHALTLHATDAAGNTATLVRSVTLAALPALTITRAMPAGGTGDVGVTYRPQVNFSRPVDRDSLSADSFYATGPDGSKLAATIVPSQDASFAWLFLDRPMPGGSTITLHLDGDRIRAANGAALLDADGDGTPGGQFASQFTTVSSVAMPATTVTDAQGNVSVVRTTLLGQVVDPGPDLEPMSFDDIRRGPDGVIHTADDVFLNPIAHAKVWVLGQEDRFVYTDAQGFFELLDVPSGNVKLAIDGRTATNAPAGVFWPEMVMDLTVEPGLPNTVMGSMGTAQGQRSQEGRLEVYLPRLDAGILTIVASDEPTVVTASSGSAPTLTEEQRKHLKLVVRPGSLLDEHGNVMEHGQVGISTVPPALVRDMLPVGLQQLAATITIQAPGVAQFAEPLQLTFPNLYGAAPGSQVLFYSFEHTTGRLKIEGTATVSADGLSITTDEGQGITTPGWHGAAPLLEQYSGPEPAAKRNIPDDGCNPSAGEIGADKVLLRAMDATKRVIDCVEALVPVGAGLRTMNELVALLPRMLEPLLGLKDQIDAGQSAAASKSGYEAALAVKQFFVGVADASTAIAKKLNLAQKAVAAIECAESAVAFAEAVCADLAESLKERGCDPKLAGDICSALAQLQPVIQASKALLVPIVKAVNFLIDGVGHAILEATCAAMDLGDVFLGVWEKVEGGLFASSPPQHEGRAAVAGFAGDTASDSQTEARLAFLSALEDAIAGVKSFDEGLGTEGWDTTSDWLALDAGVNAVSLQMGELTTSLVGLPPNAPYAVFVDNDEVLRGTLDGAGRLTVLLPTGATGKLVIYDIDRQLVGTATLQPTGRLQSNIPAPGFYLDALLVDTDGDGLSDLAESVFNTRSDLVDSDRDGVLDLAEVQVGTDPLGGRSLRSGVISQAVLLGEAKAVALSGSATNAAGQSALVATGSHGLAVVDVSAPRNPVVLSQLDLPGDALDIAFDASLGIAAVAAASGGLHLVGLANSAAPTLRQTLAINATQVEVFEGVAYTATGSELRAYDLLTGERLASFTGASRLTELARDGNQLFTLDASRTLRIFSLQGGAITALGSLVIAGSPASLFVGGNLAYVGMGDRRVQGLATVDITNPAAPRLVSGVDDPTIATGALAANGSGLLVSAGLIVANTGELNAVDVINVADPANTAARLTRFTLPQAAQDIAIGGGIAFVAAGTAGLQVINYLGADVRGRAPVINADFGALDIDPTTAGIQVLEGSTITLRPTVADDVQVRNVELLRDGQVVLNDTSYPFELGSILPTLAANGGQNTVSLQVRATDTGGNVGLSVPATVTLVADTIAPTLAASNLNDGSTKGRSFRAINLLFSEALDAATVNAATVQLIGPDGLALPAPQIQFRQLGRELQLTYAPLPQVGLYRLLIDANAVTDRAGNALGTTTLTTEFTVQNYSNEWIGPADGFWDVAANWSAGTVPTAADDVYIGGLQPGAAIVFGSGSAAVATLTSDVRLNLSGGSLSVIGDAQLRQGLVQTGGSFNALGGGAVAGGLQQSAGTFTANAALDVDRLTLSGSATLAGTGTINVAAASTWSGGSLVGTGTISFNGDLAITGTADKSINSGRIINLLGTTTWSGATAVNTNDFYTGPGTVNNFGTWVDNNAFSTILRDWYSGDALVFNNIGTYRKLGASTSTVEMVFNNTGTLDVQAGVLSLNRGGQAGSEGEIVVAADATLRLATGSFTLDNTRFGGTGTLQVAGVFDSTTSVVHTGSSTLAGQLSLVGGTLFANGTLNTDTYSQTASNAFLAGSGTFNVAGAATWSDGNLLGTGTVNFNGDLAISGSGDKVINGGRVINLRGTTTWSGATAVNTNDFYTGPGTVNNFGTWVDNNAFSTILRDWYSGDALVFNNIGTYRKLGASTSTVEMVFNNTGTLDVQAGVLSLNRGGQAGSEGEIVVAADATLRLATGSFTLDNTRFGGTGTLQVAGVFDSTTSVVHTGSSTLAGQLSLVGGTLFANGTLNTDTYSQTASNAFLAGSGTFNVAGAATWSDGNLLGTGTVNFNGDLAISGSGDKVINGGRVVNLRGTTTWSGATAVNTNDFYNGPGTVNNFGTWVDDNAFSTILRDWYSGDALVFNNIGTYRKLGASTSTVEMVFNNTGTLDVQAGVLSLNRGGQAGAEGEVLIAADATLRLATGSFNLDGTRFGGTGTLQVAGVFDSTTSVVHTGSSTLAGQLSLVGGTLFANGTLNTDTYSQTASNAFLAGSGALNVAGAATWSDGNLLGTGTVNFNGDLAISGSDDKVINGGRVVNLRGTTTWSGATAVNNNDFYNGPGTVNNFGTWVDNNAFSTILRDWHSGDALVFNNIGTYRKLGASTSTVEMVFNNTGTLDVQAGVLSLNRGGQAGSEGEIVVAADATLRLATGSFTLDNTRFGGTGTLQVAGVFDSTTNVVHTGSSTLAGQLSLVGGTLFANGTLNTDTYSQTASNAFLAGSGTFNVAGAATWSDGNLLGTGTVNFNGDLAISGSGDKVINGGRVVNLRGTTTWSGATAVNTNDFYTGPGTVNNFGTWVDDNAFSTILRDWYSGDALAFNNIGTYRKLGNTTTTLEVVFNNSGVVDLQAGVLAVNRGGSSSGSFAVAAGAEFAMLAGTHTWLDGVTTGIDGLLSVRALSGSTSGRLDVNGTVSVARLQLAGDGVLAGSGGLTISGTGSTWSGGSMSGGGTTRVAVNGELTVTDASRKYLGNRTIDNQGSLIVASTSDLVDLEGTAVLNNSGTVDVRSDGAWQDYLGNRGTLTINNSGTMLRSVGTGQFEFLDTALNNTGTVEVQTGQLAFGGSGGNSSGSFKAASDAEIAFIAGTQTWTDGANATGAGAIAIRNLNGTTGGTLAVNGGDVSMERIKLAALGVLGGGGTLTITGAGSQWTAGTMNGGGTTVIAAGGDMALGGASRKYLGQRTLDVRGSLTDASTGDLVDLEGAAVLNISGTVDIRSDGAWQDYLGNRGTLTINNSGTLLRSAGIGQFEFLDTALNNTGTVEVQTGQLAFGGSGGSSSGSFKAASGAEIAFVAGTQNWTDGANATGAGAIAIRNLNGTTGGTLAVNGGVVSMERIELGTLGVLGGSGMVTITGAGSQWTAGTMNGGGTTVIAAGADFTISGSTRRNLGARTIDNSGSFIEASTGDLVDLDGVAVFNNNGLFDIRSNGVWRNYIGADGSLSLTNTGTLRKSAGTDDFNFLNTTLTNLGAVEAQAGAIRVNGVLLAP